jgi:peptidoglycan-associated lipoprotein
MARRIAGLLVLGLMGVGAADCSHEQKVDVAKPPAVAARSQVSPASRPKAEPPPYQETSKAKEDPSIFFAFDSALLSDEARPLLERTAAALKQHAGAKVRIEGNCDQLGTVEYNLALGEQRARAAKDYLQRLGVAADRIATISYGAQRPKYAGLDDADRAKNRRDDVLVQ